MGLAGCGEATSTNSVVLPLELDASADPATLYLHDEERRLLDLTTGAYGTVVQDGEARATRAHLSIASGDADYLVAGPVSRSDAWIKSLGPARERNSNASAYLALNWQHGRITLNDAERFSLSASDLAVPEQFTSIAREQIHLGHTYVMQIRDEREHLVVCLRVIGHLPGQSVTVIWRILSKQDRR